MNYDCPSCGKSMFPCFVMNDRTGKLVVQCANTECNAINGALGPNDFNQGVAAIAPAEGAAPGWAGKEQRIVDPRVDSQRSGPPVARIAGEHRVLGAAPVMPAGPPAKEPGDVLAWIEERALWLASEEARIVGQLAELQAKQAGVRAEKKQLDKMLKAARRVERQTAPAVVVPHEDALRVN